MPYKGSKNAIAEKLINAMPDAEYFVDLFGGGGAMSHCAALSHKYKKVIYNELEPLVYKGFTMAIHGEYSKEKRWISREDFHKLKTVDPYAVLCFSFGNTMKGYAYSKEIEPWKRALHYKETDKYISEFDHDAFYKWALNQPFEVYISEYDMPLPFYPIYEWNKRSTLGTGNKTKTVEKLFCNRKPKVEVYKQLEL